jgi:hypothetical protein
MLCSVHYIERIIMLECDVFPYFPAELTWWDMFWKNPASVQQLVPRRQSGDITNQYEEPSISWTERQYYCRIP